jgi:dTDP-4-amino-4,6-dideoxygalactose transaminase
MALGIKPGDEVVTTPFTFFATVGAIVRLGAVPRFVDVRPDSLNLDVAKLEAALTHRTRAIVPVHLFGNPVEMEHLCAVADRHGVPVLEDAAQALGASYRGRRLGAWGAAGCFSFFPSKPLGAMGDGGMIVTDDRRLADRCRALRVHGMSGPHLHEELGGNFRLDALQAAILSVKLPRLPGWLRARASHAAVYSAALVAIPWLSLLDVLPGAEPAWAHYVVRVRGGQRDRLQRWLADSGIATAVYYPRPLHRQPGLQRLGLVRAPLSEPPVPPELPESERAAQEALAIPLFPELSLEQRRYVIDRIRVFEQGYTASARHEVAP